MPALRLSLSAFVSIAMLVSPVAAQDRAVLVDIRAASATDVEAWKRAAGVGWWLELGDELLLSGNVSSMQSAIDADVSLRDLGVLDVDDLVLHARGCSSENAPADLLVWPGQRHDLLINPGPQRLAEFDHGHGGEQRWTNVEPNSVIARQFRLDRPVPLGADPLLQPLVDAIDTQRWFNDIVTLTGWSRSTYSSELVLARQWIAGQFAGLGLQVSEPPFSFTNVSGTFSANNVIGFLPGTTRDGEWMIVGGHYDSRQQTITNPASSPGADDNASGCSGVIEAARIFTRFRPQTSVIFMCYAGEEQGLHGSKAHAAALQASGDLARVIAMANMDMIGWSATASLGALLESRPAHAATMTLFADAGSTYAPGLQITTSTTNACCSDHVPYLDRAVPALLSIHKNYSSYPHYHKTTDTADNLGVHAQQIGGAILRMNVAAIAQLSGASDRIFADGADAP